MSTSHVVEVPRTGVSSRIPAARQGALVFLALMYAGAFPFFGAVSRPLLFLCYLGVLTCVGLCFLAEPTAVARVRYVLPYLSWVTFYWVWGTFASTDPLGVLEGGGRLVLRTCLVMGAFVLAVGDSRHLRGLARVVGVGAVANCALCVWETFNPGLVERIGELLNPGDLGYNVNRPAGLWSNPNAAAYAFLFALLLTHWDRPRRAGGGVLAWGSPARQPLWPWLVRAASLTGIYLSASRGGLLLVAFCCVGYLLLRLKAGQVKPRHLGAALCAFCVAAVGFFALCAAFPSRFDLAENQVVWRFLYGDVYGQESRLELARQGLAAALNGPWYGLGLFTFQGLAVGSGVESVTGLGVHDVYLVVFGETGIVGLLSYLAVLGVGLGRVFAARARAEDRRVALLIWLAYLLVGFTWHGQLASLSGVFYAALLYRLPDLIRRDPGPGSATPAFAEGER